MARSLVVAFGVAFGTAAAAHLTSITRNEFDAYANRMESQMDSAALDRAGAATKARVMKGEVVAVPYANHSAAGVASVNVTDGLLNHWLGVMYLPGASVDQVRAVLQNYPNYSSIYQPDVAESKLVKASPDQFDIQLRLHRQVHVKALLGLNFPVEFNAAFHVQYSQAAQMLRVRSVSTRIAEVKDPKKSHAVEFEPGNDSGYLWQLRSYWRVYPVAGGVIVECEALSLSRSVPGFVEKMVSYFTTNFPEDSMRNTLNATRTAVLSSRS